MFNLPVNIRFCFVSSYMTTKQHDDCQRDTETVGICPPQAGNNVHLETGEEEKKKEKAYWEQL